MIAERFGEVDVPFQSSYYVNSEHYFQKSNPDRNSVNEQLRNWDRNYEEQKRIIREIDASVEEIKKRAQEKDTSETAIFKEFLKKINVQYIESFPTNYGGQKIEPSVIPGLNRIVKGYSREHGKLVVYVEDYVNYLNSIC